MKHHDLSTSAKFATERVITNSMHLLLDIPRLGLEAPCELALDQTVFRSGKIGRVVIPVKLVKVSGLKHLFNINPRILRDGILVTIIKVKIDRWQVWYHNMTYSRSRAFKLEPMALE